MALASRGTLLERFYPFLQPKRFRGKINIQRPQAPHFERAVVMQITKPFFINSKKDKKMVELCSKSVEEVKEKIDNPYERIIACELKNFLDTSRLVAFYHVNPFNAEKRFKANIMFKKANMDLKCYSKKTLEIAIKNTKYEPILDFYISHNMMVFSPELELKKLLKITKKFPPLVLIAAIFEGKLINKDQIMELDMIPDLRTAQANLVQTLNSAGCTLTQQLNTHQNTFISQLEERVKQLQTE